MKSNKEYLLVLLTVFFFMCTLMPIATKLQAQEPNTIKFGQIDFIEYWSAFHILREGKNPYSPEVMQEFQTQVLSRPNTIMMWNPPWLVLIMYPVFLLDFDKASSVWMWIQILLLIVSTIIVLPLYKPKQKWPIYLVVIATTLLFAPIHMSLRFGQIGALLLFGSVCFYRGLVTSSMLWLIIGALIMSVKPHLFFLLAVVYLWKLVNHNYNRDFTLIVLSFVTLALITELAFPNSLYFWHNSFFIESSEIVPVTTNWVGTNLGGVIRAYGGQTFSELGLLLAPITAALIFILLVIFKPTIKWLEHYNIILTGSVLFAPFGWFFDQVILLPIYLTIIFQGLLYHNRLIILLILTLQIITFLFISYIAEYQHELWWYLPILVLIYFIGQFKKAESCNSGV